VFAPVAAAVPILGGGPFAAARAADPFFSFSGRGGAGGQMTPVAQQQQQQQQQGVALDVSSNSGALPPPAARVRSCLRCRVRRVAQTALAVRGTWEMAPSLYASCSAYGNLFAHSRLLAACILRLLDGGSNAACAQVSAIGRSSSGPISSGADWAADSGRAHSESGPYGSRYTVA